MNIDKIAIIEHNPIRKRLSEMFSNLESMPPITIIEDTNQMDWCPVMDRKLEGISFDELEPPLSELMKPNRKARREAEKLARRHKYGKQSDYYKCN